jgi:hypothetical protein
MPQSFSLATLTERAREVFEARDPRSPVEQFKYQRRHWFVSARGIVACTCSECQALPRVL